MTSKYFLPFCHHRIRFLEIQFTGVGVIIIGVLLHNQYVHWHLEMFGKLVFGEDWKHEFWNKWDLDLTPDYVCCYNQSA